MLRCCGMQDRYGQGVASLGHQQALISVPPGLSMSTMSSTYLCKGERVREARRQVGACRLGMVKVSHTLPLCLVQRALP